MPEALKLAALYSTLSDFTILASLPNSVSSQSHGCSSVAWHTRLLVHFQLFLILYSLLFAIRCPSFGLFQLFVLNAMELLESRATAISLLMLQFLQVL